MVLHSFAKELQLHEVSGDEATNQEYENHNGSFATYFRNKQIKLDTQAKEKHLGKSTIFQNCLIYITGYTNPSAPELKRLITENGGQICAFLGGKSYCTHIIATNLTNRKETLYSNLKVVKPDWVTESIKVGNLLPWSRYRTLTLPGNQIFKSSGLPVNNLESYKESDPKSIDPKPVDPRPIDRIETQKVELEEISSSEDEDEDLVKENDQFVDTDKTAHHTSLTDVHGPTGDAARTAWILEHRERVNCLDKNFIKDYFAKSRLHFLSTSKLELRHLCRKYISPFAGRPFPPQQKHTLLHVDFDSFFVAVALKKRPHLIHEPVCVSHGSDGSDVASCNYVARQKGVANGQWVAKAKSLCPNLVCLPYDFEEYKKCSEVLYQTLFGLLPDKISAISVDEAMIDITHLAAARSVSEICTLIRNKISQATGINVSIGVGPNIMMAKLALRRAKPNGFCIFESKDDIKDFIVKDLPGVGSHAFRQLENLGVDTIESMSKRSLRELQDTLGNALGQKLYNYAQGIDSDDICCLDVPVRTIGLEIGWGVRVINEMEVFEFVENCGNELWDRLEKSGQKIELLTVKVHVKSPEAAFITPKYMGRGECEGPSRSQKLSSSITKEDLLATLHMLVGKISCEPLEFRGLGIHTKVSDPVVIHDPQQARIPFQTIGNISPEKRRRSDMPELPVTPTRKPLYSIPPRKRRNRVKTLTQMSATEKEYCLPEKIDVNVLGELPTQIQREIMRNEDDYIVPQIPMINEEDTERSKRPSLKQTPLFGTTNRSKQIESIKAWIESYDCPLKEDALAFHMFIRDSIEEDSAWVSTLELFECFKLHIRMKAIKSDANTLTKWTFLQDYIEKHLQEKLASKLSS